MSRLAAYLGPSVALAKFLLTPARSLVRQASVLVESDAMPDVEGYGFGWYNGSRPFRYASTQPIWTDPNLVALSASMERKLWFGFLGGSNSVVHYGSADTQPLTDEFMLFMHEGVVEDFAHTLRPYCLRYLRPEIVAEISENTESAYLFAMLRQRLRDFDEISVEGALQNILATLQVTLIDVQTRLNIVVSDGSRIIAARYAIRGDCLPLHYVSDDPAFPLHSQLVASEPLTDHAGWRSIPPNHILILDPDAEPDLRHI